MTGDCTTCRARQRPGLRFLSLLSVIVSALWSAPAPAAETPTDDQRWFIALFQNHMGREFCPPAGTTFAQAVQAAVSYQQANHRPANTQMHDDMWVDMYRHIWPCKNTVLSPAQARALGAAPLGKGGGNFTVPSVGIYASIDMSQQPLLETLRIGPSIAADRIVTAIEKNPENYLPPLLLAAAEFAFAAGNKADAFFLLHVGLLRTIVDIRLSTDASVRDAANILLGRTPRALVLAAFSEEALATSSVGRAINWDQHSAYGYDHRWVALHGARAMYDAVAAQPSQAPLTIPEAGWAAASSDARAHYPQIVLNIRKQIGSVEQTPPHS